jgi:elongation factor Tu
MDHSSIVTMARIRLLSPAEGGKTRPVSGRWLPNHNFSGPDGSETVIGIVDLTGHDEVRPGESVDAQVQFLGQPGLREMLRPGREWRIQEGRRLVGVGTVLAVLPSA